MPKFMLALLPPKDISLEIIQFQKEIEMQFAAKHAQKAAPHITIIPPFNCSQENADFLAKEIVQLHQKNPKKMQIQLDDFQQFNSKTLFVDVAKNPTFEAFCKSTKLLFYHLRLVKYKDEKHFFVPHITIANKDLKKTDFKLAWLGFLQRKYQRNFDVLSLHLLVFEDGKWQEQKEISLL